MVTPAGKRVKLFFRQRTFDVSEPIE